MSIELVSLVNLSQSLNLCAPLADSPDLAFDGEITVYYDTVTMSPEWEDLNELEDEDSTELATDTLPQDLLMPSTESPTRPTILIDHTEVTLTDVGAALPLAPNNTPPSTPLMPEWNTAEHSVSQAHGDTVANEAGDTTVHYPDSPVDYDADTSTWFPAKARDYSSAESDDESESSDDERSFDMGAPATNTAHHEIHAHVHTTEQGTGADSLAITTGDITNTATPAPHAGELVETPVAKPASEFLADVEARDTAHAEAPTSTGKNDSLVASVLVPAGNTAPLCAEEILEEFVTDSSQSALPSATKAFAVAWEDSPLLQSEEGDEPSMALSRAISVHSGVVVDIMNSVVKETAALVGAPADISGEIVAPAPEIIIGIANNGAGVDVASPILEPTAPPHNLSEAPKAEPGTLSETVVETVEPMSLAAIFGLWCQSIVYVKVVSIFLTSIYGTVEYIENIVPAGFFSVAFVTVLFTVFILAIMPFMSFTGVISVVGILLGCFHVCATSGGLTCSTCSMIHRATASKTVEGLD